MRNEQMNILVTGGAGFIGSHLCEALLKKKHNVICVDNFFLGAPEQIAHLRQSDGFVFHEMDLCDREALQRVFREGGIDQVFHLAANSDIQASALKPEVEFRNTYETTFSVLECMRDNKVRRIFFASTGAIYGDKNGASVGEEGWELEPISYYGAAKLGSEALLRAYSHMNGLSCLVFRFPNVIGPKLTHGVIHDFMRKLLRTPRSLEILGDGTQAKPYLHISDLLRALFRFDNGEKGVRIFNVGVDSLTSVSRIADIVCEKMGLRGVKYVYTGGRGGWPGDVPVFAYKLDKMREAGWQAEYSSDEAVTLTVEEELARLDDFKTMRL
jgi:UDP-glucose 4-epimerase